MRCCKSRTGEGSCGEEVWESRLRMTGRKEHHLVMRRTRQDNQDWVGGWVSWISLQARLGTIPHPQPCQSGKSRTKVWQLLEDNPVVANNEDEKISNTNNI
jgi:hypothetical protein